MERIIVPAGTAQKFEEVFKRVQDAFKTNIDKRLDSLFKKFGVILLTENMGASDQDWKPEVVDLDARTIRLNVGPSNVAYGITAGKDVLELHGALETPLSAGSAIVDGEFVYTVIFIQQQALYLDPVPVVDGFLYDETGNTSQAMTRITDQWVVKKVMYNTFATAQAASINYYSNRAALAIVRVERGGGVWLINDTWTEGTVVVTPATGGLYDIRSLNTLKLNDNLLDDTKVFFKDRDSTDAVSNPVLGKVTFKDRIHGDEDLTLSTDKSLGIGFAETDNIASGLQVHIKGGQNRGTFKLEQTYAGWASKLYLKNDTNEWGLFSDASPDEFRIGRVTTTGEIASSVNKDISIDGSTGDVTIGENLAVDGNASITGTSHVSDDATFANGVGIGYTDSEDVTNGQLKLKTGTGDGVISITTSDVVGHAKLSLKTSSGTDFDIQATDSGSLSIGRVSQSDLVIDSSGTFFIGEAFVALKSGSVAGTFTAGDNLKVDQTNNQVILGREATTLATTDTDSEVIIGSKGGNLKTNLHILTEWTDNDTVGLNIETNASANTTTFRPDVDGLLHFSTKEGVVGGYPALFTIDSVNSWVGALALDLGADGNDQDTALTVNNKNLIILNDGSTSETSIGQYDSQTFGIARNLTFDGSGLTTTQIDTSQGHAFINLETTSASGIIHFGVGAPNTLVTDQDYVMSVVQNASYSQVVIEPSATIALGSNSITSDLTASSIKTLNGNHLTYKTGTFDIATADELTVNTDTFTASSEGTYMKGYISVEGPSTLSYIDLTKSGNGAALIYDSGNSSIQLAQTTYTQVSGIGTSNIETAFLTAHMNSGYPQVDFEAFTAVSGTIDHLVLSSGIDVPYAVIGDLFVNTTDITAAHIEHLTSTDSCTLENDVMFAAANIIYSSGTIFSQEVNTATGYVTRDAYAVTVSGSDQYFIGAGQIGEASQGYPGVEIQQARPEPTTPTNFRIWDAYPTNNQHEISGYVHLRWNYDNLEFQSSFKPADTGTTCRLESNTTSAGGETFNEPTADNIIGKTLVLYPHLSKYEIGGYNNSTREITLAAGEQFIGEDENATTCHIVDRNTTGYILKVTQLISDGGSGWNTTSFTQTIPLDDDFINLPGYVIKLELGKTWQFKLKALSADRISPYVTLAAGTYDPDHDFNLANQVSYTADFTFNLPDISSTAGITTTSSPLGFNVQIVGDGWRDSEDSQNDSHEYEIIYSQSALGGGGFDNISDVTHIYTHNTQLSIAANAPARWFVAARPIQNKQPVGSGLYTEVVGGGGGIPPGDQLIMQTPVALYVSSGTVASCTTVCNSVGDDELIITLDQTYDDNGYTTDFATDTLGGAVFSFWDGWDFELDLDLGYSNVLGNTSWLQWTS